MSCHGNRIFYSSRRVFCGTIGQPSFNGLFCKLAKIALFFHSVYYWVECMTSSVISFAYLTVPRVSFLCLPWSLEERPWLQLVTCPPESGWQKNLLSGRSGRVFCLLLEQTLWVSKARSVAKNCTLYQNLKSNFADEECDTISVIFKA